MTKKNSTIILFSVSTAIIITLFYTFSSSSSVIAGDKVKTVSEHIVDRAIPKLENAIKSGKYKAVTIKADKDMEEYIQSIISQDLPHLFQTLSGNSDKVTFVLHTTMPPHLVKVKVVQQIDNEIVQDIDQQITQGIEQLEGELKGSEKFDFYPVPAAGGMDVDEFSELKEQAQLHIQENRLSTPIDNSAMSIVKQIEEQGGDASSLRIQIGSRYLVLAKDWKKKGDAKKGNSYADKAVIISASLSSSAERIKSYKSQNSESRNIQDSYGTNSSEDVPENKQNGFF